MIDGSTLFVCDNIGITTESDIQIIEKDGQYEARQEVDLFGMAAVTFSGWGKTADEARADLAEKLEKTSKAMWE